jgi:hypothetical protein
MLNGIDGLTSQGEAVSGEFLGKRGGLRPTGRIIHPSNAGDLSLTGLAATKSRALRGAQTAKEHPAVSGDLD